MRITVAKDNTGDFASLQQAIDNAEAGSEIFVRSGYYFEKIVLDKPDITITGENRETCVIIYNDCALRKDENGEELGTYKTATLEVTKKAENTLIRSLTIENSAGYGKIVGQAVALNIGADKTTVKDCRLIARQDTLMFWPCYKEAMDDPDIYMRSYFENCYIEGDVDFIFGGAAALFDHCSIYCKHRPAGYNCFITAACTPANAEYGFVFKDCDIDGDAEKGTAYLGRPWLPSAKTVFINTKAGDVLSPQVWSKWGKNAQHNAACYAQNSFTDKTAVADWTDIIDDKETEKYTAKNIFKDWIV